MLSKIVKVFRIKKSFLSNFVYQTSGILGQFIVIALIYFLKGSQGTDSFFLYMAVLMPYTTFLQLGLRQLRLSNKINLKEVFFIRLFSIFVFFVIAYLNFDTAIDIYMSVVFLKVVDLVFGVIVTEEQVLRRNNKVLYLSVLKVFCFFSYALIYLQEPAWLALFLFFLMLFFVFFHVGKISSPFISFAQVPIKSMLSLSLIATVSSLIISYPRVFLGNSDIQSGVLTFISLMSYLGVITGVIVSSLVPGLVVELSHDVNAKLKLIGYFKKMSLVFLGLVLVLYFFSVIFMYIYGCSKIYYWIVFFMLLSIAVNSCSNFLEAFSSIFGREKFIVVSSFSSLFLSLLLTPLIAGEWQGIGYAIIVLSCYALRLFLAVYFLIVK